MKNILLFLVLFISVQSWSQKNEIIVQFAPSKFKITDQHYSLNYFRNISNSLAIGVKANYHEQTLERWYGQDQQNTFRIDFVHRFHLIKSNKVFRIYGDLGLSAKRHRQYDPTNYGFTECCFGDFLRPQIIPEMDSSQQFKVNYLGASSSIGADIRFLKIFTLGLDYSHRLYFLHNFEHQDIDVKELDTALSNSSWNINLGVKF